MLREVGALAEALAALGAPEGPLAAVHAPVLQQHRSAAEALPALGAAEALVARVHRLVLQQHGALREALALWSWRGLSGLRWVWRNGRGPHLQGRQEPQASSSFRLQDARLLCPSPTPGQSMRTLNGVDGPADVLEPLYSFCESSALYFASEDMHLRPFGTLCRGYRSCHQGG